MSSLVEEKRVISSVSLPTEAVLADVSAAVQAQPLAHVATVAASVIGQAGEEHESAGSAELPKVTKDLASAAQAVAEKVIEASLAVAEPVVALRESIAEKLSGSSGISNSFHVPPTDEKKPEAAAALQHIVQSGDTSAALPVAAEKKQEVVATAPAHRVETAKALQEISRDEKIKAFVERKKQEIFDLFGEWKKDFEPSPAVYLAWVPGIAGIAKADAAEMMVKFETKLREQTSVLGIKQVLEKNMEIMASKKSKVDQKTSDKIDEAIALCSKQIASLPLKKSAQKPAAN